MNDEELIELRSFNIDLEKNLNFYFDNNEIEFWLNSGFKQISVKIFGSPQKASQNLGNDTKLFENIKKMQSLPDNIVYDFLNCKGKIKNFKKFFK
ncbi:MAG: hypothetical protein F9K45_10455 [Melioribacteraceae bacterium]|nr:MAG: hypothetical protein F9K45_10455 [Melioribacteraceae bacterium]